MGENEGLTLYPQQAPAQGRYDLGNRSGVYQAHISIGPWPGHSSYRTVSVSVSSSACHLRLSLQSEWRNHGIAGVFLQGQRKIPH